jgi:hypothetical protein
MAGILAFFFFTLMPLILFTFNRYWGLHKNTTAEQVLLDLYQYLYELNSMLEYYLDSVFDFNIYWKEINVPIGSIQLDPWVSKINKQKKKNTSLLNLNQ